MKITTILLFINKGQLYNLYMKVMLAFSALCALHIGLRDSLGLFLLVIVLDTVTAIHASAINKGVPFNPLKKEFWLVIKSKGLKLTANKLFMQYSIYALIAYYIDKLILRNMTILEFNNQSFTLPVVAIWLFIGIEIWSIGENIEKAGGVNIPKRIIHFLDEKYQKIFKKNKDDE